MIGAKEVGYGGTVDLCGLGWEQGGDHSISGGSGRRLANLWAYGSCKNFGC